MFVDTDTVVTDTDTVEVLPLIPYFPSLVADVDDNCV